LRQLIVHLRSEPVYDTTNGNLHDDKRIANVQILSLRFCRFVGWTIFVRVFTSYAHRSASFGNGLAASSVNPNLDSISNSECNFYTNTAGAGL